MKPNEVKLEGSKNKFQMSHIFSLANEINL